MYAISLSGENRSGPRPSILISLVVKSPAGVTYSLERRGPARERQLLQRRQTGSLFAYRISTVRYVAYTEDAYSSLGTNIDDPQYTVNVYTLSG